MQFIDTKQDPWQAHVEGDAPAAHRWLTLEQWQRLGAGWPAQLPVGVALANDEDPLLLRADASRLALVLLQFPKWTDGRAYSQAHLLRTRLRFSGQIRAAGDVTVDLAPLLQRSGFDAARLRDGQNPAFAQRALEFFPEGHYQGDVTEPRPRFARAVAA